MYNHNWHPYSYHHCSPYSYYCIMNSMQHVHKNQATIIRMLERIQNQSTDIQSRIDHLEQIHQNPVNTHVQNNFDKFEIYLDSISISTLSGTMQIGLFNHGFIPGMAPSLKTAPSAAVSISPESALPQKYTIMPGYGLPPGVPQTAPEAAVPQEYTTIMPGYGLPPGVPQNAPEAAVPQEYTTIMPGYGLPPGVPQTAPEAAVPQEYTTIMPGYGLPPGVPPTTPEAVVPPGAIPPPPRTNHRTT